MSGGSKGAADQKTRLTDDELEEMREKVRALGESEMAGYGPHPPKIRMHAV